MQPHPITKTLSSTPFPDDPRGYLCNWWVKKLSAAKHEDLMESLFTLRTISLEDMATIFVRLHQYIWQTDVKFPGGAFQELLKIVFIKIKKDRELRTRLEAYSTAES